MSAGGSQFSFGSGFVYGIPTQGTNLTPVLLGTLQDCSYDISSSLKELYGQLQFAAAVGRGPAKFTGKAKIGAFSAEAFNTFFFGPGTDGSATQTTVGAYQVVDKETGTPASNVYTFANTASGQFQQNLGVYYTATGNYLQLVSSAPAVGQYTINTSTGAWTFNSGDTTANATNGITVAYRWLPTTPTRLIQSINNNAFPMGAAPSFSIVHHIPYLTGGTDVTLQIYNAVSSKLSLGFKNSDFTIPDLDFSMYANSAGKVMDIVLNS